MKLDASDIATILTLLGGVWGYLRHSTAKENRAAWEQELRDAVAAEVQHALLDDPDGTANVAERLLRDAASAAVARLHIPPKFAAPLMRLAVQAGMSEVRRRIALARIERWQAGLPDAVGRVQSAIERAEAQGRAEGEAFNREFVAGPDEPVEHASESGDNGAGSEPPPATLPSGTGG